jgi:DNA-binding NarL/FixJ family response regulator
VTRISRIATLLPSPLPTAPACPVIFARSASLVRPTAHGASSRHGRRRVPGTPILVLSQYVERQYASELLADRGGGVGYLLKDRVADVRDFLDALGRVAEGRTNAGIAAALTITEGAAEKHITSIIGKLDLPDSRNDHRRVLAVLAYLDPEDA